MKRIPLIAYVALVAIATCLAVVGCKTSQLATAQKVSVATDLTVSTAMNGWGIYVDAKHPGTNAERQVLHTWQAVKATELTILDAEASLISNPTNTPPLVAAQAAYQASASNLFTLLSTITNAVNSK